MGLLGRHARHQNRKEGIEMKIQLRWLLSLFFVGYLASCGGDESTSNEPSDASDVTDASDSSDASDLSDAADPMVPPPSRAAFILGLSGDIANGSTLYATNCQACHGATGEGGTGTVLTGLTFTEDLVNSVIDGKNYMPAFGTVLLDQEIADLIAHVESL